MTFLELQNRVMNRLNLTSNDARTRIKAEINDRLKEIQSSVNLSPTRRGNVNFTTVSGNSFCTASGIAKIEVLYDPTNIQAPLNEASVAQLRAWDTAQLAEGPPTDYAIYAHNAEAITLLLYPQPQEAATLKADALLIGTELEDDADEPTIPDDFQDTIVLAVMSDEYDKMEKARPLADKFEKRYQARLADLRYFLRKSSYLSRQQTDVVGQVGYAGRVWPYSNVAG